MIWQCDPQERENRIADETLSRSDRTGTPPAVVHGGSLSAGAENVDNCLCGKSPDGEGLRV